MEEQQLSSESYRVVWTTRFLRELTPQLHHHHSDLQVDLLTSECSSGEAPTSQHATSNRRSKVTSELVLLALVAVLGAALIVLYRLCESWLLMTNNIYSKIKQFFSIAAKTWNRKNDPSKIQNLSNCNILTFCLCCGSQLQPKVSVTLTAPLDHRALTSLCCLCICFLLL